MKIIYFSWKKKKKKNLSRSQRPPRLYERPPGGGTAPVEKPCYKTCSMIVGASLIGLFCAHSVNDKQQKGWWHTYPSHGGVGEFLTAGAGDCFAVRFPQQNVIGQIWSRSCLSFGTDPPKRVWAGLSFQRANTNTIWAVINAITCGADLIQICMH